MNFVRKGNEGTTRREFAKTLAAGTTVLAASGSVHALNAASTAPPQATRKSKYGKHIIPFVFQEWVGPYRQYTKYVSEFPDLTIEYGVPAVAGRIAPAGMEVHDFNQVVAFIGTDMFNVGDLNADVEFFLGPEREKRLINISQPVLIPKGMPHSANITRMDRQFIIFTCSQTSNVPPLQFPETPVPAAKEAPVEAPGEAKPPAQGMSRRWSKYRTSYPTLNWYRKGRGSYGEENMDDHGGMRFAGSWREPFDFSFSYQSVLKGPYRFESNPYRPHVHAYDENLFFIGTDPNDLSQLGGEYMMCIGEEMERHVINVPSIMHLPKGLPHCPLYITRVDKPLIFSMFHAFRPLGDAKKPPA